MTELERRCVTPEHLDIRSENGDTAVEGYAAVYDSETLIGAAFREVIRRGAFDRSVREDRDVVALWNHDPNYPLGRRSAGNLELSSDDRGLWFRVRLPSTQYARDVAELLQRGDVTGASFGFCVRKDRWTQAEDEDTPLRELLDVDLYDVSVVTFPAYQATHVSIASYWASELRAVVPFEATPTLDADSWDADAAVQRVRQWATGNDGEIDWSKYRRAFAWYDSSKPDQYGSYKLPHHDVRDGTLVTHRRGVIAAMQALLGARGGVDIPDKDRRRVYSHLAKHYRQFDMEPPPFRLRSRPPLELLRMKVDLRMRL